jgi:hypothetical protein
MSGIYISYRRTESAAYAGRLFDHLSRHFDRGLVFMGIQGGITRGQDFALAIESAVNACDVALVVIEAIESICSPAKTEVCCSPPPMMIRGGLQPSTGNLLLRASALGPSLHSRTRVRQPSTYFDIFRMLIPDTSVGNVKEFELLQGNASSNFASFQSIGKFQTHYEKLFNQETENMFRTSSRGGRRQPTKSLFLALCDRSLAQSDRF